MQRCFRHSTLSLIAIVVALLIGGCRSVGSMPQALLPTYEAGVEAQMLNDHSQAILHFDIILNRAPQACAALRSRAHSNIELATQTSLRNEQNRLLVLACDDLAAAIDTETRPRKQAKDLFLRGRILGQLAQHDAASECYQRLVKLDPVDSEILAAAHARIGNQVLASLTKNIALDTIIADDDLSARERLNQARFHFSQSLRHENKSLQALFGMGSCFLHEGRAVDAENYLNEAMKRIEAQLREAGMAADSEQRPQEDRVLHMKTLYLLGVAKQLDLGENAESNRLFKRALTMDLEHNFQPVYARIYQLLNTRNAFPKADLQDLVLRLLQYCCRDETWIWATEYFASQIDSSAGSGRSANEQSYEHIGLAVAYSRTNRPEDSLSELYQAFADDPQPCDLEALWRLIFPINSTEDVSIQMTSRYALARSAACRSIFQEDDYAGRPEVWQQLRSSIKKMEKLDLQDPVNLKIYLRLCHMFAEEILLHSKKPSELAEARRLTLQESSLDPSSFRAAFRIGLIELRSNERYELFHDALNAIERDQNKSYLPAFRVVAARYQDPASQHQQALLKKSLLQYQGDDAALLALKQEIKTKAALEAKKALEAQVIKAKPEPQVIPPRVCHDCGYQEKNKKPKLCKSCGAELPKLQTPPANKPG